MGLEEVKKREPSLPAVARVGRWCVWKEQRELRGLQSSHLVQQMLSCGLLLLLQKLFWWSRCQGKGFACLTSFSQF